NSIVKFYYCVVNSCKNLLSTQRNASVFVYDCYLHGNGTNILINNWSNSHASYYRSVFVNTPGAYNQADGNWIYISCCGFFSCYYAIHNANTTETIVTSSYIDSTCTYGAYGYNITLVGCTNNAGTPVYNLTSGGS